jgi:hypothetical protein
MTEPHIQARRKRLAAITVYAPATPVSEEETEDRPQEPITYRFHLCQPHAKCPDLTGWYLELRPDDAETVIKVHRSVAVLYFFRFGQNPHITPTDSEKTDELGAFYNPIKLAAQWLCTVEHYLLRGETLLVNSNGGIMPMEGAIIFDTVESSKLHWNDRFEDEIVTVSRWPQAKHWYLASSKHRVFIPGKYNSYDEAHREALRYVPTERIKTKECAGALPPE